MVPIPEREDQVVATALPIGFPNLVRTELGTVLKNFVVIHGGALLRMVTPPASTDVRPESHGKSTLARPGFSPGQK
ncbi:hypothetical protein ACFS3C_18705 [Azotobacter vinelandii]